MWRPVTAAVWAGCLWLSLAAASANSEIYGRVSDNVTLTPQGISVTGRITTIMWRDGPNIAMQWDGTDVDRYRHFGERGHLDTSNGVMTITGLSLNDSGEYTAEINNARGTPVRLIVLSPIPVPTVVKSCDAEMTRCDLTCDGDTTGAEPATYTWKSDDNVVPSSAGQTHVIVKEDSTSIKEFSCELNNPVSKASSLPILNPFTTTTPSPEGQLKISTGVFVFIILLVAVLGVAVVHRVKAGMWFFQKASMPWEADFWRKPDWTATDTADTNGTIAPRLQADEETPMT